MEQVKLLNGKGINQDYDLQLLAQQVLTEWVVEWLVVSTNSVSAGKGYIEVVRTWTPSQTFYVLYENTEALTIDTSGTKKVYIEITQANIDNSALNTETDGTWIWEIKTGASYPSTNYIPLASITTWTITDEREMIQVKNDKYTAITDDLDLKADKSNVLELDNTTAYTPTGDYNPATKKFVVDSIASGGLLELTAWENITANDALYVSWTSVYKTDADDASKLWFIGFATNTATTWNDVLVKANWLASGFSGLTPWSDYYLSDTAWAISTTPWTNEVKVGIAVEADKIRIKDGDVSKMTFWVVTKSVAATSDTLNITHWLWKTPRYIKITTYAIAWLSWNPFNAHSEWTFDGTNYWTVYDGIWQDTSWDEPYVWGISTTKVIYIPYNPNTSTADNVQATCSLTSTEIQLSFTNTDSSSKTIYIKWEAYS